MSSYLNKSKQGFKPKISSRRNGTTAAGTPNRPLSVRGSTERRNVTPQPQQAYHVQAKQAPAIEGRELFIDPASSTNHGDIATTARHDDISAIGHEQEVDKDTHNQPQNPTVSETPTLDDTSRAFTTHPTHPTATNTHNQNMTQYQGPRGTAPGGLISSDPPIRDSDSASRSTASYQAPPHLGGVEGASGDRGPVRKRLKVNSGRGIRSSDLRRQSTETSNNDDSRDLGEKQSATVEAAAVDPQKRPQRARQQSKAPKSKKDLGKASGLIAASNTIRSDRVGSPDEDMEQPTRARRKRGPTPEEAENAEITPSAVTMLELTSDSGLGRQSYRYHRLKEKDKEELEKRQDKVRQQMQSFMNGSESNQTTDVEVTTAEMAQSSNDTPTAEPAPPAIRLAPRVKIVNGQIVQDEETRTINRHANVSIERPDEEAYVEDELTRRTNQGSYMKRERKIKWTEEQTSLFYEGLRMFGTDFQMISKMFPGRNRRQIKLKFTKEERMDHEFIRQVLIYERKEPNIEDFQQLSGEIYRDTEEMKKELAADRERLEAEQRKEFEAIQEAQKRRELEIEAESRIGKMNSAKENEEGSGDDSESGIELTDHAHGVPKKTRQGRKSLTRGEQAVKNNTGRGNNNKRKTLNESCPRRVN